MEHPTFIFALGAFLFAVGVSGATLRLEKGQHRLLSKVQPIFYLFLPLAALLAACISFESLGAIRNIFTVAILIALCACASWSVYQVIYALITGKVRRFQRQAGSVSTDLGYYTRVAEPGWFWYHLLIYALQAGILLVPFVWFVR